MEADMIYLSVGYIDLMHLQGLVNRYRDNIKILENKKALYGADTPTIVEKELVEENKKIIDIVGTVRRWMHKLQEQQALYGISTPPEILIKIEDAQKWLAHNRPQ